MHAATPGLPVLPGFYSPPFAVTWSTWFGTLVKIPPCPVYPVWFPGQNFATWNRAVDRSPQEEADRAVLRRALQHVVPWHNHRGKQVDRREPGSAGDQSRQEAARV